MLMNDVKIDDLNHLIDIKFNKCLISMEINELIQFCIQRLLNHIN